MRTNPNVKIVGETEDVDERVSTEANRPIKKRKTFNLFQPWVGECGKTIYGTAIVAAPYAQLVLWYNMKAELLPLRCSGYGTAPTHCSPGASSCPLFTMVMG